MRVGVITNGVQSYQEGRLKRAGLYELFDFFYYGDTHQKPDPAFFNSILENENVEPHELLVVGDHVEKDIAGALGVGAKAVWVREGSSLSEEQIVEKEETLKRALQFKTMYDFLTWLKQ